MLHWQGKAAGDPFILPKQYPRVDALVKYDKIVHAPSSTFKIPISHGPAKTPSKPNPKPPNYVPIPPPETPLPDKPIISPPKLELPNIYATEENLIIVGGLAIIFLLFIFLK